MTPETSLVYILLLLVTIGAAGGFLSGLLGVGGGGLFVPALYYAMFAFGFDKSHSMHIAVATSLLIVFATGSTSAVSHYRRGGVDVPRLKSWGPYILLGVIIGAFFASAVNGEVLKRIFAVMTLLISAQMAIGRERSAAEAAAWLTTRVQRAICVAIGAVSSMIGVGGAVLTVPMMSHSGVPMQKAVGTGAALGVIIALPGSLGFMIGGMLHHIDGLPPYSIGYVNLAAAAAIIPTAMLMAPVGVRLSHAMPRLMLRRVFAAVMMIVSIRMFMSM
ncbi:MAG TPA: sulfite exporter TauE/SafE family protein [Patescibacteria group bacterium]|nr:sulfite exporter TauE/SafE family protein [Patescibacteria group bacterium]